MSENHSFKHSVINVLQNSGSLGYAVNESINNQSVSQSTVQQMSRSGNNLLNYCKSIKQ